MTLRFTAQHVPQATCDQQQVCLFADVVGSTNLALRLPVDLYATLMTFVLEEMLGTLHGFGATLLPHQGDAVIALWDEWRLYQALSAAQQLHDNLLQLKVSEMVSVTGLPPLQLRIGLASGVVCCGQLGQQPCAYGLPLHLARRLCSAALPGETLVCERIASLLPSGTVQTLPSMPLSGFGPPTELHAALPLQAAGNSQTELTLLSNLKMKIG